MGTGECSIRSTLLPFPLAMIANKLSNYIVDNDNVTKNCSRYIESFFSGHFMSVYNTPISCSNPPALAHRSSCLQERDVVKYHSVYGIVYIYIYIEIEIYIYIKR